MVSDSDKNTANPPSPKRQGPTTTYPGQSDGRISAAKHAGMRSGASRPGPKKK